MRNLFSTFDPSSSFFNLNWTFTLIIPLMGIPLVYWTKANSFSLRSLSLINSLAQEFRLLTHPISIPGISFYTLRLFTAVLAINARRLLPYVFSCSAHPSLVISMIAPLWVGVFFYAWRTSLNHILSDLVPARTPNLLIPIMVLIELLSSLIRPLTLTIRLTANISAGHLLLTLISSTFSLNSKFLILPRLLAVLALLLLELGVSLIQAYVFSLLLTLTIKETNFA